MKKLLFIVGAIAVGAVGYLVFSRYEASRPAVASPQSAPLGAAEVAALKLKAEQGDPESQAQLGKYYASGQSALPDYRQAAKWYQKAADKGNSDAQAGLGELYQTGQGVKEDAVMAVKFYRVAADLGHAGAQYNLAEMYQSGAGIPKDQAQAANWYRMAAEQGNGNAQYNLGQRYDLGVGVSVDRVEAFKWLSLAVAQGVLDNVGARERVKAKLSRDEAAEASRRIASFAPRSRTPAVPK